MLPKEYLETLGLQIGSQVEAALDEEQEAIILFRPRRGTEPPQKITADFARRVRRFIDRNRATLDALAK